MCQLHKTLDVPKLDVPKMWDRDAILKDGIKFLADKRQELEVFQKLWKTAQEPDYYSQPAKIAAEKVSVNASQAREEVQKLKVAVTHLVNEESSKAPLSCTMKKLEKISEVTSFGYEYFKSVADASCFPSLPNQLLREARLASNQLAFTATVLTVSTHISNEMMFQYELPWYLFMPMKVSLAVCLGANVLSLLNVKYRCNPGQAQVEHMRNLFDKALAKHGEPAAVSVTAKAA